MYVHNMFVHKQAEKQHNQQHNADHQQYMLYDMKFWFALKINRKIHPSYTHPIDHKLFTGCICMYYTRGEHIFSFQLLHEHNKFLLRLSIPCVCLL